jgi:hypothetical protein
MITLSVTSVNRARGAPGDLPGPGAAICYEVEPLTIPARFALQSELVANEKMPGPASADPRAAAVLENPLSACTQAVMAAEVGHLDPAFDYLGEAALMDLRDVAHNTRDGLHIASLAGAWIAVAGGFGGLRHRDGTIGFAPRLPQALSRLAFTILIRGRRLRVEVTHTDATYALADGEPLEIVHYGEKLRLSADKPEVRPIHTLAGTQISALARFDPGALPRFGLPVTPAD